MRLLWKLKVAAIALMLTSCGASWHLKRAIAKNPALAQDTVLRIDTTIISRSVEIRDTIVIKEVDTIQVVKNGVVVDIRRSFDTIEVDVQCPPDTIRIFKEIPMVQIVPEKKERNIALGGVIGFILALVLIRVAGRFIK
jgi:hypothetical protein